MGETTTTSYEVKLGVFEGPLDLLLHLIKQNEINIYDIPIALITHQYLEYLNLMKSFNLTIAGEFLVMAATLIHIKSKTLLPPSEIDEQQVDEEDPRAELIRRLIEYKQFKEAAEYLGGQERIWREVFWRRPTALLQEEEEGPSLEVNLFDLLDAFKEVFERVPVTQTLAITVEELSVKDKMNLILEQMEMESSITFLSLFQGDESRMAMIVTFLALLELIRLGLVRVLQIEVLGPIRLLRVEERDGG
jgi:segregation and condensation protein A